MNNQNQQIRHNQSKGVGLKEEGSPGQDITHMYACIQD